MSRLLSEESYQALTVILQGANMGEGYSLIMNLPDWETHWKQSKKNWKNKAKEISRMQLLLSQKKKLIFSLKKRSWEQVLHNRYWTLCGWIIFYTSVSEVAQNNEMYVVVMLFWRLTVKAENILFIQRDKLRADRATTHRMLGLWNRECTKTKKFKRSAIQWMCINYTPNANMADHSDGPGLVAWKRGQSVCQSRLFPNVLIIANGCMCSDWGRYTRRFFMLCYWTLTFHVSRACVV